MQQTNHQNWLRHCSLKFDQKFNYDKVEYINANTPVLIGCPVHGEFSSTPWHHRKSKHGCSKCADAAMGMIQRERSSKKFWELVEKNHGNRYGYTATKFDFITDRIEVSCPVHGPFEVIADHHMRGVMCTKCADLEKKGAYTEKWFASDPNRKNIPGLFYMVRMISEDEDFIKIGITRQTVEKRFRGCPYSISILNQVPLPLYSAFEFENEVKSIDQLRYYPKTGLFKTESFQLGARKLLEEMISTISGYKVS